MHQFSCAGGENESQSEGCDLSRDSQELTPLKRDNATDAELELTLKLLKKDIKFEKD